MRINEKGEIDIDEVDKDMMKYFWFDAFGVEAKER